MENQTDLDKLILKIKRRLLSIEKDSETAHAYMAGLYLSGCAHDIQKSVFGCTAKVDIAIQEIIKDIENLECGFELEDE